MPVTKYGISLIKKYEGCPTKVFNGEVRAIPYIDPVGYPTIGWGKRISWDQYRHYQTTNGISMQAAHDLLVHTVDGFARGVNKLIKVPIMDYELDALVSFAYNVGIANFKSSTLLRKLNNKDYVGASREFPRWVYARGKKLKGLVNRREAERRMFINSPPRDSNTKLIDEYFLMLLKE